MGDSVLRREPSEDSKVGAHSDSVTQVKIWRLGTALTKWKFWFSHNILKDIRRGYSIQLQSSTETSGINLQHCLERKAVAAEVNISMERGCKESCGLHRAGWMQLILLLPLLNQSQEKKAFYSACSSCRVLLVLYVLQWFGGLAERRWDCFVWFFDSSLFSCRSLPKQGRNEEWYLVLLPQSNIVWCPSADQLHIRNASCTVSWHSFMLSAKFCMHLKSQKPATLWPLLCRFR